MIQKFSDNEYQCIFSNTINEMKELFKKNDEINSEIDSIKNDKINSEIDSIKNDPKLNEILLLFFELKIFFQETVSKIAKLKKKIFECRDMIFEHNKKLQKFNKNLEDQYRNYDNILFENLKDNTTISKKNKTYLQERIKSLIIKDEDISLPDENLQKCISLNIEEEIELLSVETIFNQLNSIKAKTTNEKILGYVEKLKKQREKVINKEIASINKTKELYQKGIERNQNLKSNIKEYLNRVEELLTECNNLKVND